jgi:hypothetical protein
MLFLIEGDNITPSEEAAERRSLEGIFFQSKDWSNKQVHFQ